MVSGTRLKRFPTNHLPPMTNTAEHQSFLDALAIRKGWVNDYLDQDSRKTLFVPQDIHDGVLSYLQASGKVLRPCVLYFSCGAVGGKESIATPAAVAIELFHTWTIVHDDIMDRDTMRRGARTVHEEFRQRALGTKIFDEREASHYGLSIGIMTGEVQHGWAISLLSELYDADLGNSEMVIELIRYLETEVLLALVGGQALDIQYAKTPMENLDENTILDMFWRKTGVLYEFAGAAGAMIGLNTPDRSHTMVRAISSFTGQCGVAFQLKDDMLGLTADEATLGKPVCSDLREGKRTVLLIHAYHQASVTEKRFILNVIGNPGATDEQLGKVRELILAQGSLDHVHLLMEKHVAEAIRHLEVIPDSCYKRYLVNWAEYLIGRSF